MRTVPFLRVLLGFSVLALASNFAFIQSIPAAQAAEEDDFSFGSPKAIRNSHLDGDEYKEAVKDALAEDQAQKGASIDATSITGAPNLTETYVQNTSTWAGLLDQETDAGGRVFMLYTDTRDGVPAIGASGALYLRRSLDGGVSWQPEVRLDQASGVGTAGFGARIAIGHDGSVYVVWDDYAMSAVAPKLVARVSRDNGATWGAHGLVSATSDVDDDSAVDLKADAHGNVYVAWEDDRSGDEHIYSAYSTNHGTNWATEVLVDDAAAGTHEHGPVIELGRTGEVIITWRSDRFDTPEGNEEVFTAYSDNYGATFSADMRVNENLPGTSEVENYETCSDGNGTVYQFYGLSTAGGEGSALARISTDYGKTYPTSQKLLNGTFVTDNDEMEAACSFGSSRAVVVFSGGPAPSGNDDMMATATKDGGATWTTPTKIDMNDPIDAADPDETLADIDSSGRIFVAYTDARSGADEAYANYSLDNGTTWQSSDFKMTNGPTGAHSVTLLEDNVGEREGKPTLTNDRLVFDVSFHDTRAGTPGLYFAKATFSSTKNLLTRLSGADRVKTGLAISKNSFPTNNTATALVLGTSVNFPDGLAGGPLSVAAGGPLLINPQASLSSEVAAEILRVLDLKDDTGPDVYVLGGTAAISSAVEASIGALHANIDVKRLPGTDRIDTALKIADEISALRQAGPSAAMFANSQNFPDALAASAPASSRGVNSGLMPILINKTTGGLDSRNAAYLSANASTLKTVHMVGGTTVLPDSIKTAIDAIIETVNRHFGANRYGTAVAIANAFFTGPMAPLGMSFASGVNFPDALTGGAHAGRNNMPLGLVKPTDLPDETSAYVSGNAATIDGGFVYGGTAAVSDTVKSAIEVLY
jgi:putative cell wall-binding protein